MLVDWCLSHLLALMSTSTVPLYLLHLIFYPIQCVILFILYVDLCTSKNYKKLILWKYTIRQFEQDPTWLYFYLHISHNIQNKLERWIVPKTKCSKYFRMEEVISILLINLIILLLLKSKIIINIFLIEHSDFQGL